MLQFNLNAKVRSARGKSALKSLRSEGRTPAVMYGPKTDTVALDLDAKDLSKALLQSQRRNAVFTLDVDDNGSSAQRHVMVKEIQTDPIKDTLVHTDFCEVLVDQPIVLDVPINYTGTSRGVEMGGVLSVNLQSVSVRGLVLDMPDFFEIDITELEMGQACTCEQIVAPAGLELLETSETVCATIVTPKGRAEDDEEEEAGEEAEAADAESDSGEAAE